MKTRILAVAAGVVLLMGILTPAVFAQMATVRGVCKDMNGKPLAGATVELVNSSNGIKKDLKTNKNGEYFSLGIPAGTYTYHLIVDGKEVYHLNKVQVDLNSPEFVIDIDLQKEQANAAKGIGLSPEQQKAVQEQKAKQEKENSTVKNLNAKLAIAVAAFQKAIDLRKPSMKANDEDAKKQLGGYYNEMAEAYARQGKTDDAIKT